MKRTVLESVMVALLRTKSGFGQMPIPPSPQWTRARSLWANFCKLIAVNDTLRNLQNEK